MIILKQSTAATLRMGPAMAIADGVTPVTTVDLTTADQAELLKHSGATVDISAATWAAITGVGGWYDLSLTTSHTDTVGMLTVVVQDASLSTPIFARAMVVPATIYDALVAGTASLPIQSGLKRNAETVISFPMRDTTGAPLTGSTVTVTYAHGTATTFSSTSNSVTEKASGFYHITLTAAEMNSHTIQLRMTGSGGSGTPADNGMTIYTDP